MLFICYPETIIGLLVF